MDSQVTGHEEYRKAKKEAEARAPSVALPTGRGEGGRWEEKSWQEPDTASTQTHSLAVHQLPGHWLLTLATKTPPPTACGHPAECFHRIVLLKLCLNDVMETNHAQCVFPSFGFPNGQVINSNASKPAQFCFSISAKLTWIIIHYSAFLCVRRGGFIIVTNGLVAITISSIADSNRVARSVTIQIHKTHNNRT